MVQDDDIWLIVGLGNPGEEYDGTRHNAGFMAADAFARDIGANYWKNECGSLVAVKNLGDIQLIVAKPQTFMNLSGNACSSLCKRYSVHEDHMVVIHDDLDIPCNAIRIKAGGGHGGHNGIRSIIEKTGSRNFPRVKIGIGRPPGRMPVVDYVLQKPKGEQEECFLAGVSEAAEAIPYLIEHGIQKAQSEFNGNIR